MANVRDNADSQRSPVWDVSQERAFIETLVNQRFNFFLIFFSLVIAGAVNAKVQQHLNAILIVGSIVCCLLARVLWRVQKKLNLILGELHKSETHPAGVINKSAGGGSARNLIGYVIPLICCTVLILATVASFTECLKVPPPATQSSR
jgi:hypothetical protein